MIIKIKQQLNTLLPESFITRGAVMDDLEASVNLFNLWSQAVIGKDELTDIEALRNEWVSPGFDPAQDVGLVIAQDGTLVGYIEVWTVTKPPVHPWFWGRVHPAYSNLGIGTYLLQWAEDRACQALDRVPDDLRFAPYVAAYHQAKESRQLFENLGYSYIRSNYRMMIDMDNPPAAPTWPERIQLKVFNLDTDLEAVYRADIDSFRDHFGFTEEPFVEGLARFKHMMTAYEGFDPSLWFMAMDGNEVAGICLCRLQAYDDPDVGLVNVLGVRRPWRKRGIGLALLQHAFGELYRRGQRKASLGVDSENLTGALRLYQKAGMHIHYQMDLFEKEIRPGKEIRVQSLEIN